jgi:hypothetical protein
MKAVPGGPSDDEVDALFRLPLAEFTSSRNGLAAKLKEAGRRDEADRVKALAKPSVPAWVANQIFWRHRGTLDALIAASARFRRAQAAQLAGRRADLREALEAQRAAFATITGLAVTTLRESGATVTPDLVRRVTSTLDALSTSAGRPDAPRAGRLTDDLQPAGFETLAALVPNAPKASARNGPSRLLRFGAGVAAPKKVEASEDPRRREDERRRLAAAARAAVLDAERELADAQRAARKAEAALRTAAARASQAESRKAEAERQMERAATEADEARQQARRVAAAAEEAAQLVQDAERALDAARQEMKRFD